MAMRDEDRLREKREIALDDRQIAGLSVAALLLLGGVFTLGLLVGKHLAVQPAAVEPEVAEVERKPPPPLVKAPPPPPPVQKEDPPEDARPTRAVAAAVVPAPKPAVVVPAPQKAVTVAAASAPAPALTPPPKDPGEFTVQVGASQDRVEAQRLEQKVRAKGLKPYVLEAD